MPLQDDLDDKMIMTPGGYQVPTVDRTGQLLSSIGGGLKNAWNFLNTNIDGSDTAPGAPGAPTAAQPDFAPAAATGLQAGMDASQMPGQIPPTNPLMATRPLMKIASNGPVSGGGADQSVKDAIASKYGFGPGLDSDAIKAAQAKAQHDTLMANLGEAGNDIANGFAAGRGSTQKLDNSFYEKLKTQAQQPLQNIQQLRQAKLGDVTAQATMAENDPNSEMSQNMRKIYSQLGIPMEAIEGASAAQLKQYQNPAELIAKIQASKDSKQAQMAYASALSGNKNDLKADEGFKTSLKGNEAYKEADTTANTADSLVNLVNQATTNKASAQALATELANFASKGKRLHTATVDAFSNPNSDLMTRISQAVSKSEKGTITPDVAKDIVGYLNNEKNSATTQKQLVMRQEAEDFNKLHGRYPKLYDPSTAPAIAPMGGMGGGGPQDPKISGWASQHNVPYDQAASILRARGYQGS